MFNKPSFSFKRYALFSALGGWLLFFSGEVSAGEKIKFSEDIKNPIEIPGKNSKDDLFTKPFDGFKSKSENGSSLEPSLPSLPPSLQPNNRKDKNDKDNWIFSTPKNRDEDALLREIFGVREYDLGALEKKSKSGLERLQLSGDTENNTPSSATLFSNDRLNDRLNRKDPNPMNRYRSQAFSEEENLATNPIIPELSLEYLLRVTQSVDPVPQVANDLARILSIQNSFGQTFNRLTKPVRAREQDQESKSVEKLLGKPKFLRTQVSDLLNSPTESARQQVNPVVGKRMTENSESPGPNSGLEPAGRFGEASRGASFSALDSINSRSLGASSGLSLGGGNSPTAASAMQPKPPVLDMPRRHFP
jgi:hypothetical protein